MEMHNIKELSKRTADMLGNEINKINQAPEPSCAQLKISFKCICNETKDLICKKLNLTYKRLKVSKCLYFISLDKEASSEKVRDCFENARRNCEEKKAFSKLNLLTESKCLYVGSSKNIRSRILQHIGFVPDKTYALRIKSWSKDLDGGIEITIISYDKIEQSTLLYFEEQLSKELKPISGKRGSAR